MKKETFGITVSCLTGALLSVLVACNNPGLNTPANNSGITNPDMIKATINTETTRTTLKGKVQFPGNFATKAAFSDVAPTATVSLITTANASSPNVTIATGLTDNSGVFALNPSSTFSPTVNTIYVLEATKRLLGPGSSLLSLRTYVKWNGTGWDSMTKPGIFINTWTTALSVISALNSSTVPPSDTIGTITVDAAAGTSTPSNLPGVTGTTINTVAGLAKQALANNNDPVFSIAVDNGNYFLNVMDVPAVTGTQIDRAGLPALATALVGFNGFTKAKSGFTAAQGDAAKDAYNLESPSTDVANHTTDFINTLMVGFGRTQADATALAGALLPDVLPIDVTKATSFASLNGRLPADDVIDVEFKLLSGNSAATDKINANDKAFTTTFPYLAAPF